MKRITRGGYSATPATARRGLARRGGCSTPTPPSPSALTSIEETGRTALEDLDHVLGLLREEASAKTPQRTLADLGVLFEQTRSAGVEVDGDVGEVSGIPPVVSREAYRIVQEGPDQRATARRR